MTRSVALLVLAFVLLCSSPVRAEVAALDAAGVSIVVPKGWTVKSGTNAVAITAKDGSLGIMLLAADDRDVEQVWTRVTDGAITQVPDLAISDRGQGQVGGMPALLATANGTVDGTGVSMVLGVITTPAGNHVALLVTVEKPKGKAHAKAMQKALDSITAIAPWLQGLSVSAAGFAGKLTAAIDASNNKRFLALVSPSFSLAGVSLKRAKVKSALKKWPAKKGGIAGYLGLGDGDWHVQILGDSMFTLLRGDGSGAVTLIVVERTKGKWLATGTLAATGLSD